MWNTTARSRDDASGTFDLDLDLDVDLDVDLSRHRTALRKEDPMSGPSDSDGDKDRRESERSKRRKKRRRRRRERHRDQHERWASHWQSWGAWDDSGADESMEEAAQLEQLDDSLLSDKGRALLQARRRADRKVKLYRDLVRAGIITLACFLIPPVGVGMLIYFSVKLGPRAYRELLEPEMRERLVRAEVEKQLEESVHEERRALQDEHARSLEQLSARVAHEIRNPITAAKSLVQQMGEEPASSDNMEYARIALSELERVERSVSHLLRYARDEDVRLADVKLAEVLESALETFRERAARGGVELVRAIDCEGAVRGDAEKLRRVVINLVGNAIDSLEEANVDSPRVEISLGENLAGTEIWLRVQDNGVGIEPAALGSLFDPFVTSKSTGTGLGLPITKKLVESHGGTIEATSEIGSGAEFVVTFPKNAARASAPRADS